MLPLIALLAAAAQACAEDRIVMRTSGGSRIGLPCTILDYTGREVAYQTKQGTATRRLPRRDLIEVTTHYNPPHTEAREMLAKGQAKEAFAKLDAALDQENRAWVRREILATQVKCALWNGDRVTAGERFLAILDSDPNTLYFSLMPLSWSEEPPSEDLVRASRNWLTQTANSAAMLLAASHLLTDERHSTQALRTLKELARDGQLEIQRYGQIQLWRVKTLTEEISRDELFRWQRTFDDAGDALGGGSRYIVGTAWQRRHDDVAAAAAWLWLPLMANEDRWLAAQAAWNAAQALDRAGQKHEASALNKEIAHRFAGTPAASRATEK